MFTNSMKTVSVQSDNNNALYDVTYIYYLYHLSLITRYLILTDAKLSTLYVCSDCGTVRIPFSTEESKRNYIHEFLNQR